MVLELRPWRHYAVKHQIGPQLSILRTAMSVKVERGVVLIFVALHEFW
jgi:hypothetical protein